METIKRAEAVAWLRDKANFGVPFEVRFVKKSDNTIRRMSCKTGVDDFLTRNPLKPGMNFKSKGLISVYDTNEKQYKCFAEDKLLAIKIADEPWKDIEEATIKKQETI